MQPTWVFARDGQRIEIRRGGKPHSPRLVIAPDGEPTRVCAFPDQPSLTRFQNDMEQFLTGTGWSLAAFMPERRAGRDRRAFPRLLERRRWWTG